MAKLNKILVFGGTGFLGSNFIDKLSPEKFDIYSISLNKNSTNLRNKNCKYYFFDASNNFSLHNFLIDKKFDYIINFSGYIEHSSFDNESINIFNSHINILINIFTLTLKNPPKRLIQIGSADEYGFAKSPQFENLREEPLSFYGLAKLTCSHLAQIIYKTYNYPICVIRPFIVYGPGQSKDRLIPYVINSCLTKKRFEVSEGSQERDFLYIEDFVDAIMKSLFCNEVNGEIINIGSGKAISVKEIILKIHDLIKSGEPLFGKYISGKKKDNPKVKANISKAKKILNWEPKIDINKGLEITISKFK